MCSASLQSADQDLNTACAIYRSLIVFVQKLRPTHASVECTANQSTNCEEYRQNTQRTRKRNQKYDGSGAQPDEAMTAADTFRVSECNWSSSTAWLPRFRNAVKPMRGSAPDLAFCAMFGQCRRRNYLCSQQHWLNGFLMTWRPAWPANLCNSLFAALLDTDIGRQATSIASQLDATDDDIDVITTGEAVELRMYRIIRENTMQSCFPNVELLLRMYLCLMVTNSTGERSFSKL